MASLELNFKGIPVEIIILISGGTLGGSLGVSSEELETRFFLDYIYGRISGGNPV